MVACKVAVSRRRLRLIPEKLAGGGGETSGMGEWQGIWWSWNRWNWCLRPKIYNHKISELDISGLLKNESDANSFFTWWNSLQKRHGNFPICKADLSGNELPHWILRRLVNTLAPHFVANSILVIKNMGLCSLELFIPLLADKVTRIYAYGNYLRDDLWNNLDHYLKQLEKKNSYAPIWFRTDNPVVKVKCKEFICSGGDGCTPYKCKNGKYVLHLISADFVENGEQEEPASSNGDPSFSEGTPMPKRSLAEWWQALKAASLTDHVTPRNDDEMLEQEIFQQYEETVRAFDDFSQRMKRNLEEYEKRLEDFRRRQTKHQNALESFMANIHSLMVLRKNFRKQEEEFRVLEAGIQETSDRLEREMDEHSEKMDEHSEKMDEHSKEVNDERLRMMSYPIFRELNERMLAFDEQTVTFEEQ